MSIYSFYKYDEEKWDWTRSAVTKFKNGFKRFDGFGDKKEQVFVGVYGPTQVGKTTFILSLLGIDFRKLNCLSDALRGGQEKGKSATVTCTIFQKTEDKAFIITWPSGRKFICSDLQEVEQVMQALRGQVYLAREFSLSPLLIDIPQTFFDLEKMDQRVRDLSIIDLPGDDSKDELEMRHVNRILKEYIPRCKVNIIMEIASQVTGLTKLDKDLVKDWTVLPEQFRVLLTRSVTNGSVKKAIDEGKINSSDEITAAYVNELKRVTELEELQTPIYPLEFGDSWADLKHSDPELFEKTNPWMEEIFSMLTEDLTTIDSPEQEIKKLKSMERYIKTRKQEELDRLTKEEKRLAGEFAVHGKLIQLATVKGVKEEITSIRKVQLLLKELYAIKNLDKPTHSFPAWSNLERKVSLLNLQFLDELDSLEEFLKDHTEKVNRLIKYVNLLLDRKVQLMEFPSGIFPFSLGVKSFPDLYILSNSYKKDVETAKWKLASVFSGYQKELKRVVKRVDAALKISKHQKRIDAKEEKMYDLLDEYKKIEKDLLDIREKIEKAYNEWEEDLARSRQLDLFLMEGFVERSNHYKVKLLDQATPAEEKWLIHQYWNVLKHQAERIIDYVD